MNRSKAKWEFEMSVSGRNDGAVAAAYFRLRTGRATRTREIVHDALLADYDARGNLVGIEILAPVRLAQVVKLIDEGRRRPFRRFVRQAIPRDLLAA